MGRLVIALALAAACAGAKESRMVKLTGTVAHTEVVDLTKKAGVPNLYTRVTIAVESADDPRLTTGGEVELQKRGEIRLSPGTRVEATTQVPSNWRRGDRLAFYELKPL
jgi:hypothetical protein